MQAAVMPRLSPAASCRSHPGRIFLTLRVRGTILAALLGLLAPLCAGQGNSPITLDTTNETLFAVLTAVNACGFDDGLSISDPVRLEIRAEVEKNLKSSDDAQATANAMCDFYQSTRGNGAAHDLSQYVSLALYLHGPPNFLPKVKEDEMPPDAGPIAGFGALLEKFYEKAGLHAIWERHKNNYAAVARRYHEPLAKMVFDTEIYLKLQSGGYLGRDFTVYLDFMGDPSETNARNYGTDYDVVVFPAPDSAAGSPQGSLPGSLLKMNEIRHTFLHYLMDPLAEKHPIAIKRLEPLLQSVKRAPLEEGFRTDISLLVTECLVRAIEIRTAGSKATAEAMRAQAVDDAVRQGYILTKYFYSALVAFEKDPAGIRSAYSDILDAVDVRKEQKEAAAVDFAKSASPELLQLSRLQDRQMLVNAEKRLAAGDAKGARELAQQAMDKKIGDQGRALFILAEVAVANKDMPTALDNFHKAIAEAKEPRVIAWSHVYLGRIMDLKDDRPAAVIEYQAALTTGGQLPEIKAAAERGLARAYEPPAAKPQ
jgi:tetratricopeptide (TPR) repeat protein